MTRRSNLGVGQSGADSDLSYLKRSEYIAGWQLRNHNALVSNVAAQIIIIPDGQGTRARLLSLDSIDALPATSGTITTEGENDFTLLEIDASKVDLDVLDYGFEYGYSKFLASDASPDDLEAQYVDLGMRAMMAKREIDWTKSALSAANTVATSDAPLDVDALNSAQTTHEANNANGAPIFVGHSHAIGNLRKYGLTTTAQSFQNFNAQGVEMAPGVQGLVFGSMLCLSTNAVQQSDSANWGNFVVSQGNGLALCHRPVADSGELFDIAMTDPTSTEAKRKQHIFYAWSRYIAKITDDTELVLVPSIKGVS